MSRDINLFSNVGTVDPLIPHLFWLSGRYISKLAVPNLSLHLDVRDKIVQRPDWQQTVMKVGKLTKKDYDRVRNRTWPEYDCYSITPNDQLDLNEHDRARLLKYLTIGYLQNAAVLPDEHDIALSLPFLIEKQWASKTLGWYHGLYAIDNLETRDSNDIAMHSKLFVSGGLHDPIDCYQPLRVNDTWFDFPGIKVVIYTDIQSYIRLVEYKQSNEFYSSPELPAVQPKRQIIKKILTRKTIGKYHRDIAACLEHAEVSLALQDLINDFKGSFEKLGLVATPAQIDLIQRWKSLHPRRLLDKIGIN